MYEEVIAALIPYPFMPLGRGSEKSGTKLSPGRKEGLRESVFKICFLIILF